MYSSDNPTPRWGVLHKLIGGNFMSGQTSPLDLDGLSEVLTSSGQYRPVSELEIIFP